MCDLENIDSHLTLQLIWGNCTEPQPGNACYPQCYTITYARQIMDESKYTLKVVGGTYVIQIYFGKFPPKRQSQIKKLDFCVKAKVNVTKRNKNIGMSKHRAAYM